MALMLFNTLSRKKEVFRARRGKSVGLYTCGPTVYRSLHIGNYRTYIFEDILLRTLTLSKFKVRRVMNITDVGHLTSDADEGDDKMEREAKRTKQNAWDIARQYTNEFLQDINALNIVVPESKYLPRATDHIKEQVALIKTLEKKGFTYKTSDGIYFDTSRFPSYGALAGRAENSIRAGARIALGEKRRPTDFALWKFSGVHRRQMEWKSPWGTGFPGWHLECSAMAMKYLGKTIDIHCGGIDHKETHHPNEIAQSEAATGVVFARFWMHGAFLTIKGEKMAKSNPEMNITLRTIQERGFDPLDFRYLTLGTHYRKPLSFSWEALNSARLARKSLITAASKLILKKLPGDIPFEKEIFTAISDDLNTPKALAALWMCVRSKKISQRALLWSDKLLGLDFKDAFEKTVPPEIIDLAEKREVYRKEKNWQEADVVREQLKKLGFSVEDTASGPVIHRL